MNQPIFCSLRGLCGAALLLSAAGSTTAVAATHSENFESASGNANGFQSASGMLFTSITGGFVFSTGANSYYAPFVTGTFPVTGCNGCTARTMQVTWPSGQRSLVFGWGTQGYTAVRVTAYRSDLQVWQNNQTGTASNGLYKQQFSRTAANAGEYFDRVEITWPGGGQAGTGYASLLDNVTSTDAYAALLLDGNHQEALVNTSYAAPLAVVVRDFQNQPVAGIQVVFEVSDLRPGAPSVVFANTNDSFDAGVTDSNGIAMTSAMSANGVAGTVTLAVRTWASVGSATFELHNVTSLSLFANGFE